MKTKSGVLCALAVVISFVGCCDGGDHGTPKCTFECMIDAAKQNDKNAMMDCFTTETRADFEKLEKIASETEGAEDKDITEKFKTADPLYGDQKIDGDKATLMVTIDGDEETIQFAKEGGDWKITIPELKSAIKMMEGMGDMMKNMIKEKMENALKEMEKEIEKQQDQ